MGAECGSILRAMKGSVPVEERAAFQKEMQSQVEKLTPQERREFASAKRKKRPNARVLNISCQFSSNYKI